MKFIISRTSAYGNKPLGIAIKEKLTYLDRRTLTLENMKKNRKDLYSHFMCHGKNHRTEGTCAVRDVDQEDWTIEINSLEELIELKDKEGKLIVKGTEYKEIPYEIEIYDDYRE
jgi:hypothetical protein